MSDPRGTRGSKSSEQSWVPGGEGATLLKSPTSPRRHSTPIVLVPLALLLADPPALMAFLICPHLSPSVLPGMDTGLFSKDRVGGLWEASRLASETGLPHPRCRLHADGADVPEEARATIWKGPGSLCHPRREAAHRLGAPTLNCSVSKT